MLQAISGKFVVVYASKSVIIYKNLKCTLHCLSKNNLLEIIYRLMIRDLMKSAPRTNKTGGALYVSSKLRALLYFKLKSCWYSDAKISLMKFFSKTCSIIKIQFQHGFYCAILPFWFSLDFILV